MWKLKRWLRAGADDTAGEVGRQLPVDPLGNDFLSDPFPIYDWLRREHPVAKMAGGGYLLTRHTDIEAMLKSDALGNAPSRFSRLAQKNRDRFIAADMAGHIPPFLDAPAHITPRKTLVRAFYQSFDGFERLLSRLAAEIVADLPSGSAVEVIQDVASPFAVRAIRRFIGVGDEFSDDDAKRASLAFFHLFAPIRDGYVFEDTENTLRETREMLKESLRRSVRNEVPGLLFNLDAARADYPDLDEAMIVDNAILVLADGIENIEAAIARILHLLRPDADTISGHAMPDIVREALRLESPAQIIPRVCRRSIEIGGIAVEPDVPVFLALGSANRDPEVFQSPDSFIPGRAEAPLTFGLGRHRCIGEQLGLRMIEAALSAMLERGVQLAAPDRAMEYQPRFGHRWPMSLDVVFA